MGVFGNSKAAPELVNSKTSVLWDMDTCPVPEGYDARRVRPSIESALKNLGYLGPVTISAMGNLEKTPAQVLQGLSSTGIAVTNYVSRTVRGSMLYGIRNFKTLNPPPATIMIISDKVADEMTIVLSRNQQSQSGYNLVVASNDNSWKWTPLFTTANWLWKTILADDQQETRRYVLHKCSESGESASFFCESCEFTAPSVTNFTSHLSTKTHKQNELRIIKSMEPDPMEEPPKRKANRRLRVGFRTYHVLLGARRVARRLARRCT
uniref:NYN domain-containing protein n=1 Tax=Noccaea caerulescens TaxID=107243 RepID=A0A1J3DW35_NOCCA